MTKARPGRRAGRLFLLSHTPNHLGILDHLRPALARVGLAPFDLLMTGLPVTAKTRDGFQARGLRFRNAAKVLPRLGAGDRLLYFLQEGLEPGALLARGVRLTQLCEGCRFNLPGLSHPDVPFLGWGPSAQVHGRQLRIVGAPVLEAVPVGPPLRDRAPKALINVKFKGPEVAPDAWLQAALNACDAAGLEPVLSGHPALADRFRNVPLDPRPVAQLCAEVRVVISRPSTVVYEALMAGAQPFLFPTRGEGQVELADPRGAFPIAPNGDALAEQVAHWQAGRDSYGPDAFLSAHLDRDSGRPAVERILAALEVL